MPKSDKFTPMALPAGRGFKPSADRKGSSVKPEVVVPIRPGQARQDPRLLFDASQLAKPRTIFPIPEPEPEPEPEVPAGPTPEEIAQMVRDAEERGYRRGVAEMEQAIRDNVEQERRLGQVAHQVDAMRGQLLGEARADAGVLVVAAVQHICGTLPEALASLLETRLGEAAEQLADAREVVVHVRPADVEVVQAKLGERKGWRVAADPSVRGGCRVTSANGQVDATLSAAFEALDAAANDWRAEVGIHGGD